MRSGRKNLHGHYDEPMRARLSDIAQQAGVSEATVSRVLNDRPGVSPDTRQAVLTALDVLGYERPERLRKRSAGLVGLVVPELDNPIFPAFAQVIESALAQSGYTPVLCTQTPGGVTEDEYVDMLLDRQVSGIVFVAGLHADTTASRERYERLVQRPLPIVLINGHTTGIDAPFVSCDDRVAGETAVSHLIALGHRRIGFISGPDRAASCAEPDSPTTSMSPAACSRSARPRAVTAARSVKPYRFMSPTPSRSRMPVQPVPICRRAAKPPARPG